MKNGFPKAVIFDMDGTIVDSMPYHQQAWKIFLEQKGIAWGADAWEKSHRGTLYDIMPRFFGENISKEEMWALGMEKEKLWKEIFKPHAKPLPGLVQWFDTIKQAEIPMALATAADQGNTDFTLDITGLRHYFKVIVTSNQVAKGKPEPDVYWYAARELGVSASDCIIFEDTVAGVEAGLAAGASVVAITTTIGEGPFKSLPVRAIIHDYEGLTLDFLRNQN